VFAQDETDKLFQEEIRNFVAGKIAEHGDFLVSQEKFLLTLISLTNMELRSRVGDVSRVKAQYFSDLKKDLEDVKNLEERLHSSGINDFDLYISQLKSRIQTLLDNGIVDYKKKRVLEDAVQLLLVAEEMTRLGGVATSSEAAKQRYYITKKRLEEAFNRIGVRTRGAQSNEKPTLYDLYKEWLRLNLTEFEAKFLKINYFRNTILRRSSRSQMQNMLVNELDVALRAFNRGDFDLALRLFEDLYNVYHPLHFNMADVAYFAGEASVALQRYPNAEKWYVKCHTDYPGTEYDRLSLVRLIQLAFIFEDSQKQEKYFEEYISTAPLDDPYREELFISMAIERFNRGQFKESITLLQEIGKKSKNYTLARYLTAKAYAAMRAFDQSKEILKNLASMKNISPELFYRIVLKYALILYEEGNYSRCISLLQRIGEEFSQFDLVLDVLAWAEFKYEQSLPIQEQNYKDVLQYIDLLLGKYYGSPYELEMKALRAYILEITNHPTEAIDQYEEVYLAKKYKKLNDQYLQERENLRKLILKSDNLKFKAVNRGDKEAFKKVLRAKAKIQKQLDYYTLSELSSEGSRIYSEVGKILKQLKEIQRLKAIAKEKNDKVLLKRLDDLELRLNAVLAHAPINEKSKMKPYNFFELVPSSKFVSEMSYRNQKILNSRRNLEAGLAQIKQKMKDLEKDIERARLTKNTKQLAAYSREKLLLQEMKEKYERLLSMAYSLEIIPINLQLNKWADLGAFGIINVNFSQRKKAEEALKYNANLVSKIEEEFRLKKKAIEDRIRQIEAQIKIMTMKAREEERKRVRAERERSFREGYFDTRTSEFEPLQPEINLEGAPTKESPGEEKKKEE
jgi:TolA-binding protein